MGIALPEADYGLETFFGLVDFELEYSKITNRKFGHPAYT
jgi:hypothetical protein